MEAWRGLWWMYRRTLPLHDLWQGLFVGKQQEGLQFEIPDLNLSCRHRVSILPFTSIWNPSQPVLQLASYSLFHAAQLFLLPLWKYQHTDWLIDQALFFLMLEGCCSFGQCVNAWNVKSGNVHQHGFTYANHIFELTCHWRGYST